MRSQHYLTASLTLTLTALLALWISPISTKAQTNLLSNPGFEEAGRYSARQGQPSFNMAESWGGWFATSPRNFNWQNVVPEAYPHTGELVYEGGTSQEIGRSGGTFKAAIFQTIPNIAEGTALKAEAWAYIENGPGSGAEAYIGIGSNVGEDPNHPNIVWSAPLSRYNSWQIMTVSAIVPAGSATVFIWYEQAQPNGPTGPNRILIDQASLVVTGTGTPNVPGSAPAAPAVPTRPPIIEAPFVTRAGVVEGDKLVHIVKPGDTLAAIALAYGTTLANLRELNGIQGGFLAVGQRIIVGDAPTPTPALPPTTAPVVPTVIAALPTPLPSGPGFALIEPVDNSLNSTWTPVEEIFEDIVFVQVPEGCFTMGNDPEASYWNGAEIILSVPDGGEQCFDRPFWISKTEITQGDYARLIGPKQFPNKFLGDMRPVEQVTWFEAQAFCEKIGGRLPTEAEWEYAARGPGGWFYPWGNQFISENATFADNSRRQTAPVDARPEGASWVGALGMADNVAEWTVSNYAEYPYNPLDGREPADGTQYVAFRGGSWSSSEEFLRSANRDGDLPTAVLPFLGFRCVRPE
ncbi:MAG: SUMF1/EgtB/PvdO family nonheme iron enzyme [Anaerolineae bacterium]|nr:SUMF1/EgtB/PvdO family nonheme iron enzyme [Anaerolineae bacterium]